MAGTAIGAADNTDDDEDDDDADAEPFVAVADVVCAVVVDLTELSRLNIAQEGQNERFEVDAVTDASAGAPMASLEGAETEEETSDATVDDVVGGGGDGVVDAVDVPVNNAIAFNSAALNSEDIVQDFFFAVENDFGSRRNIDIH